MVNRIVSVGDDFTLPPAVKIGDANLTPEAVAANLPARLEVEALDAAYVAPSTLATKLDTTTAATTYASNAESLDFVESMYAAAFPMAMGTPPTLTKSGPGGASPIATPTLLPYTTTQVTKLGCLPVLRTQYSTDYYTNGVNGNWTSPPWAIEFTTDAAEFALRFRPETAAASFYITVDGYPVSRTPYNPPALSSGSLYFLKLAFKTSAPRTVRIHMGLADFGGLDMAAGSTTTATTSVDKKVAWLGDSWTEGTAQAPYPNNFANVASRTLTWFPYLCGQGGTGYTTPGGGAGREVLGGTARLADITSVAPDYIVIAGSQNDDGAAGIQAAAAAVYSSLASSLPATKIIVIGPQSGGTPSANRLTNRSAVKAAALAAPNVVAFIDPIAQNWVNGTGKITARTGAGNADYMLGADGAHPSIFGAHYYGKRSAQEIVAALVAAGLTY